MIWQIGSGAELGWSPAIVAEVEAAMCDERSMETACTAATVRNKAEEVVVVPAERRSAVFRGVLAAF